MIKYQIGYKSQCVYGIDLVSFDGLLWKATDKNQFTFVDDQFFLNISSLWTPWSGLP